MSEASGILISLKSDEIILFVDDSIVLISDLELSPQAVAKITPFLRKNVHVSFNDGLLNITEESE